MRQKLLLSIFPLLLLIPLKKTSAESFRKQAGERFQLERINPEGSEKLNNQIDFEGLDKLPNQLRRKLDQGMFFGFSFNQKPRMGLEINF